jgi:hypothetical protein
MNQILKPARPGQMGFGGDPVRRTGIDPRALRDDRIEYDDGEPATIVPAMRRPADRAPAACAVEVRDTHRTSLGRIDRTMAVDYDDGDPATIVTAG